MRNNKGVTLVALVITIIVLLILAGVSLAMLTGDSGILTNAENAKKETAIANAKDAIDMAYMDIKTEVYAIDAKASTTVMNSAMMKTIADKYCDSSKTTAATDAADATSFSVTINYETEGVNKVITYTPNPTSGPKVVLADAE